MKVLVTGAAGFIGGNLMAALDKAKIEFIGIDNFSTYYDPEMKRDHLSSISANNKVKEIDVCDEIEVKKIIDNYRPTYVVHLAAQGGVRASKSDPLPYLNTNQIGFLNVLKAAEEVGVEKFIYASSSSVYGEGLTAPFSESDITSAPKSLYALSKLANELIARYLPRTKTKRIGLRFFTVYGPWGRPDMAIFRILASSVLEESFIFTANNEIKRDFTFVDDVSKIIINILNLDYSDNEPEIYNVAGGRPHNFSELFQITKRLEIKTNVATAQQDELDVTLTHASTQKLKSHGLDIPDTLLSDGVRTTWEWIKSIDSSKLRKWYEYRN